MLSTASYSVRINLRSSNHLKMFVTYVVFIDFASEYCITIISHWVSWLYLTWFHISKVLMEHWRNSQMVLCELHRFIVCLNHLGFSNKSRNSFWTVILFVSFDTLYSVFDSTGNSATAFCTHSSIKQYSNTSIHFFLETALSEKLFFNRCTLRKMVPK